MRILGFALAAFLICPALAFAEPADRALAIEYLKIAKFEEVLSSTIKQYDSQLFKDAKPEDRAKFREILESTMSWDATKDQLADLVLGLYTKEELEAYIKFSKSPIGSSFNNKSSEFATRYASLAGANLQSALQKCVKQSK